MEILDQLAKFAQSLLVISLPIIAVGAVIFIYGKVQKIIANNVSAVIAYRLNDAAVFAVNAAEQYLKSADGKEKKLYAMKAAQRHLEAHGIKLDLLLISDAIEAALFTEFNQDKKE